MDTLLIVDDNEEILKQLRWGLKKTYKVLTAKDTGEAAALISKHCPKVLTLDLGLPPDPDGVEEGLRLLGEILSLHPKTKVIVLTGKGEKENAIKAIAMGAYDFYSKPIDLSELKVILARAFHLSDLEEENSRLAQASATGRSMGEMVGQCPQMQHIFSTIDKIAASDVPVLVLGESGTGKELVARAIHAKSMRCQQAFVPINCGAIPGNLLESELFGHEKGAFTGAQSRVRGRIEYANDGTLFLDEIGELPTALQVKLLRFLQEKEIQRVGGRERIEANARIITATNIDIDKAIESKQLREDLYYRIGVISVHIPPLRERGDDIGLLANYFLQLFANEHGKRLRGFSTTSLAQINSHPWPGNVRELENKVKRAVIMAGSSIVQPEDLGFLPASGEEPVDEATPLTLKEARGRLEVKMITSTLENNNGNVAKAAEELGVSRPTMYDLMKKHGLRMTLDDT